MAKVFIQQQYPHVTAELVRVQRELQEILVASAEPVAERRNRPRREALERRRAELLDHFGRLGLGWMMLGGTVELVVPTAPAAGATDSGGDAEETRNPRGSSNGPASSSDSGV